ncbi:MAG: hypothetical protein IKC35_04985 [Clostridia bacterium]|nr:hypothetical protein [Clostridia bacterium]
MYSFNRLFSQYVLAKGHVHEEELASVYDEWYNTPNGALNASPKQIVDSMSDSELVEELIDECCDGAPSLTVMENLEKRGNDRLLTSLLYEDNSMLVYCAAELLRNMDKAPLEIFANMLSRVTDVDLFELIVSALKEDPDSVREDLLDIAQSANQEVRTVIAEILSGGSKDERVYKLLTELFASGDNLALYATYLARYGDEKAAGILYRALENAPYADYIEIRNAIEMLGGVVDEDRDFSADPEYILIKENAGANK